MAIEARPLNPFLSLPIYNNSSNNNNNNNSKEMLNSDANMNINMNMIGGAFFPASDESVFPVCNDQIGDEFVQRLAKTMSNQDDSGLTFSNTVADLSLPTTRKRPREFISKINSTDMPLQMTIQQQLQIDRLIFLHTEKVRLEIEEKRRDDASRLITAIEQRISNILRGKEEEIQKSGKINAALQDRVKSLYLENQLWRDLAQSNEATANALRSNLEQLLVQVNTKADDELLRCGKFGATADDAESCCASSGPTLVDDYDEVDVGNVMRWRKVARTGDGKAAVTERMCRRCGGMESSVLVLPCRHLCLCTACAPTVHVCPICNSTKNASVLVNFS